MTVDVIPEVVRQLITDRVDSIPELEAILLLRQHRDAIFTAEEAGKRLYVSVAVAAHMLEALIDRGIILRSDHGYRYGPESPELEEAIDLLAATYSKHLIAVTNFVHAKPSAGVRLFAQAFRFRKDKDK